MCKCKLVICLFISPREMYNRQLEASFYVRQLSACPYKRRSRPFLQFKHVPSVTSINVHFERPVARDVCTNVCMIFPLYIPKACHGTQNKVDPFPGIINLTVLFHFLHLATFKINLIILAFAVIQLFASLCLSVHGFDSRWCHWIFLLT
jgi:hypothetical protein